MYDNCIHDQCVKKKLIAKRIEKISSYMQSTVPSNFKFN